MSGPYFNHRGTEVILGAPPGNPSEIGAPFFNSLGKRVGMVFPLHQGGYDLFTEAEARFLEQRQVGRCGRVVIMPAKPIEKKLAEELNSAWPTCASCGKHSQDLKRCARCKAVAYCSKECQKKHWKQHKSVCPLLAGMVMPSTSSLHFVYSWHISRLPSYMHVPNGICTAHLDRCRLRALGGLLRDGGSSMPEAASGSSNNIMREAALEALEAAQDSFHMGIALTDGMGLIGPALLTSSSSSSS